MKQKYLIALAIGVAFSALMMYGAYIYRPPAGEVEISGLLRYFDIETGCWVIETGPARYQPLGVKFDKDKDNGKLITAKGRVREDIATTCMSGTPFEITSYKIK